MKRITVLIVLLLTAMNAVADNRTLEVIPLKHRLVNDVLPLIKPLVEPGGTVTGSNNQIIIKASPANIAEIKNVLNNIDNAPLQLMITVKQDQGETEQHSAQGISGRYGNEEITVEADGSLKREDLLARIGNKRKNQLSYEQRNQTTTSSDRGTYRVQATEGYPAHIQAGMSLPYSTRNTYVAPGNVIVQDSYQYQDATSGFYVLPRLQGDTVTLQIAPRMVRVQSGDRPPVMKLQDVQTVVSGRLGEWIPIGGVNQSGSRNSERLSSRSSSQSHSQGQFLIRVDEVRR